MNSPEPPSIVRISTPSTIQPTFVRYAATQYQRCRFPIAVSVILGLLLAAAMSWLKPSLGISGLYGLMLGTAVLAVGTLVLYLSQVWYAYFITQQRAATGNTGRTAGATFSVLGVALFPLVAICVAEHFGPAAGYARTIASTFGVNPSNRENTQHLLADSLEENQSGSGDPMVGLGGKSASELRKELSETTRRMDGAMATAVEVHLEYFESGESGWGWSILDDQILNSPNFSKETKSAYMRWRDTKIVEDKQTIK